VVALTIKSKPAALLACVLVSDLYCFNQSAPRSAASAFAPLARAIRAYRH
jgi:hypothetical protein